MSLPGLWQFVQTRQTHLNSKLRKECLCYTALRKTGFLSPVIEFSRHKLFYPSYPVNYDCIV